MGKQSSASSGLPEQDYISSFLWHIESPEVDDEKWIKFYGKNETPDTYRVFKNTIWNDMITNCGEEADAVFSAKKGCTLYRSIIQTVFSYWCPSKEIPDFTKESDKINHLNKCAVCRKKYNYTKAWEDLQQPDFHPRGGRLAGQYFGRAVGIDRKHFRYTHVARYDQDYNKQQMYNNNIIGTCKLQTHVLKASPELFGPSHLKNCKVCQFQSEMYRRRKIKTEETYQHARFQKAATANWKSQKYGINKTRKDRIKECEFFNAKTNGQIQESHEIDESILRKQAMWPRKSKRNKCDYFRMYDKDVDTAREHLNKCHTCKKRYIAARREKDNEKMSQQRVLGISQRMKKEKTYLPLGKGR